jgi:accessory secretory protein Asp1
VVHDCLEKADVDDFVLEGDNIDGEIEIPKEERIFLRKIMTGNDLLKELKDIRLIVDLRHHPDVFTMIAGMSSGIPQIVRQENDYVKHQKNGLVLSHSLLTDLKYYLEDLDHWNASLVYCYSMIQENTGEKILNKWKEIINHE